MDFESLNKRKFSVNTDGFGYASLADLFNNNGADMVYIVRAIYINTKGKFGDAPVIATDKEFVNLPKNCLSICNTILASPEAIQAINNGECGVKIRPYHSKTYNKDCYGVDFVNVTSF